MSQWVIECDGAGNGPVKKDGVLVERVRSVVLETTVGKADVLRITKIGEPVEVTVDNPIVELTVICPHCGNQIKETPS